MWLGPPEANLRLSQNLTSLESSEVPTLGENEWCGGQSRGREAGAGLLGKLLDPSDLCPCLGD